MIKATELRIGNIIWHHKNHALVVGGISDEDVSEIGYSDQYLLEDCEGIKLAEELLLKFGGFVDDDGTDRCFVGVIHGTFIDGILTEDHYYAKVTYVHELQNLHFSLTGQELIKRSNFKLLG